MTDFDPSGVALGKLPVRDDPRTLQAAAYLGVVSPAPPVVDWQAGVPSWPMYQNDRLGCCTISAAAHLVGEWTYQASAHESLLSDSDVVTSYSAVSGYDPATGANDNGAVELDVLNYWRKTGVGGHRIVAYAKLDASNHGQIRQAIAVLGAVYVGAAMPVSAQGQTGNGRVWDVTSGPDSVPGSWGGHAFPVGAYDANGLECVTWGATQRMTWAWWTRYVDECYACVSKDFLTGGRDPQGFDLSALLADLNAISHDQPNPSPVPPSPPVPVPPTPPVPPPPTPIPPADGLTVTITDPGVAAHVKAVAAKRHLTPDEWVTHHFAAYFGSRAGVNEFGRQ